MEKELLRVKEENFQDLLNYKKEYKKECKGMGGCLSIRHDYETDEFVLVHTTKKLAKCAMESASKMAPMMEDLEDFLEKKNVELV